MNYYNEFDPAAAAWLRELIGAGLIPKGEVDERSIADVRANELRGYTQCHFFAGIGGWSLALQLAGWPADRPVWTGSCPCQAFSTAGKQRGFDDERDLWPVFANLIAECKPEYVFGEQVENAIRHGWLDRVCADMEGEGYAVGAAVLGAHSVGAPHRRQRLYWGAVSVADRNLELHDWTRTPGTGRRGEFTDGGGVRRISDSDLQRLDGEHVSTQPKRLDLSETSGSSAVGRMANNLRGGCGTGWEHGGMVEICGERSNLAMPNSQSSSYGDMEHAASDGWDERRPEPGERGITAGCESCGLADSFGARLEGFSGNGGDRNESGRDDAKAAGSVAARGVSGFSPWSESGFIYCRDGKIRRVPAESIFFSVADGFSGELDGSRVVGVSETGGFPLTTQKEGRAMLLKGYGNAIVPQLAAEFIRAFMETAKEDLR